MGNFPLFPQSECTDLHKCKWQSPDRGVQWKKGSVKALPGYFAISLTNGVFAEMTVTNRSALYRFEFAQTAEVSHPTILVDLIDLQSSPHGEVSQSTKSQAVSREAVLFDQVSALESIV